MEEAESPRHTACRLLWEEEVSNDSRHEAGSLSSKRRRFIEMHCRSVLLWEVKQRRISKCNNALVSAICAVQPLYLRKKNNQQYSPFAHKYSQMSTSPAHVSQRSTLKPKL